jgi:hypothetical protein
MYSCSCLLQGGGLGLLLLLEEEAGGLDAATGSGILGLLDNGLESSMEGRSLSVVRHGDRMG